MTCSPTSTTETPNPPMDFRDVYYDLVAHTIATDPTPSVGTGRRSVGFLG
jgi:hypothetical protein